jgi:hypothetical protein
MRAPRFLRGEVWLNLQGSSDRSAVGASRIVGCGLVISSVLFCLPWYVLGMIALKQLAFSLVFAIAAVAAAQYMMWVLNGQP